MKILIIYYSQSGQLKELLENIVTYFSPSIEVNYVAIRPKVPFPYPWTADTFFDAMPETVLKIQTEIEPPPDIIYQDYDLVLLGYQPWFLNVSQPIYSFLNSDWAEILKGKKVITVIGSRNMWLNAQETVKTLLLRHDAHLIGNIVLRDKHSNIISTLTVIRWMFKGQKTASKWLPAAGISEQDIAEAKRFAPIIEQVIKSNQADSLQDLLLDVGAVDLTPSLIVLEKRGLKQFPIWAKRIRSKGLPGDAKRLPTVRLFKNLLIVAVFILSPISSLAASIQTAISRKKLIRKVEYFKRVNFQEDALS